MPYLHYRPAPPLSQFVDIFWYYQGEAGPHKKERLLPQGSAELVINLQEDELRLYDQKNIHESHRLGGAAICGPHSRFFVIDTAEQDCVVGVHFKPAGLFPFFHLPAIELHNEHVSLDVLWGRAATSRLRDRVLEGQTPQEKLRSLEQCMLEQIFQPLEKHRAVNYALVRLGSEAAPISVLSDEIGISSRRLVDVFSRQVGLTPKLYSRVQRFQKVIQSLPSEQEVDWVKVALDCGYYDQAHFNHDFRSFSGLSPTTYLKYRTGHTNHVPIYE